MVIKRNEPMFEQTINSLSKQITEECIKIFDDSDKFFRIIDSPELDLEEWNESQQPPDQTQEQNSSQAMFSQTVSLQDLKDINPKIDQIVDTTMRSFKMDNQSGASVLETLKSKNLTKAEQRRFARIKLTEKLKQ